MRRCLMLTALAACGPQVVAPEDDGATTNASSSPTTGVTASATRGDDTSPPVTTATTTPPPPPSTGDDTTGTSATGGTSTSGEPPDSGDDLFCSCEGRPATLRTVLEEGNTPLDVLQFAQSTSYPWTWLAVEDLPPTTLQIDVVYEGGAITDEVGGCCGSFLCAPCPNGVTIEVFFRLTTDDGLLDEYVPGILTGTTVHEDIEDQVDGLAESIAIGSIVGTLAEQPFVDGGKPVVIDAFAMVQSWSWSDGVPEPSAHLFGHPGSVFVGASDP